MSRRVKGILFADYVRMLRAAKGANLSAHLSGDDMKWLGQRIEAHEWYPMESYERLGLAILDTLADADLEAVRQWGRRSIDLLHDAEPELFSGRDPRETFMRFQVLRQTLFNFPAAQVIAVRDGKAIVELQYGMGARAEEAAAWQSVGFLERLMELSGAAEVTAAIESATWRGDAATRVHVAWAT